MNMYSVGTSGIRILGWSGLWWGL